MRAATAWPSGWWARLLLLACTLLGLAAMHTIGHGAHSVASHPDGHAVGSSATVVLAAPAAPAVPAAHVAVAPASGVSHVAVTSGADHLAAGDGCAGDGCRRTVAELSAGRALALPAEPPGDVPSGWSVCLAVLGAATVALLLAALLLGRARLAVETRRPRRPSRGPRAPPPGPVGLRLATVSVLRR